VQVIHPALQNILKCAQWKTTSQFHVACDTFIYIHYSNLNGPLLRYIHPVIFAKQASTIIIPQTMSMQDSQNAKKQFGPELYSYLLLHGRGHQSWLSWLARWAWCLLQVAAVQFLLLKRETLADHYRATPCQVPATWQGRVRFRCSPGNLP